VTVLLQVGLSKQMNTKCLLGIVDEKVMWKTVLWVGW